jgi:lysophospholipase L1-like esterase
MSKLSSALARRKKVIDHFVSSRFRVIVSISFAILAAGSLGLYHTVLAASATPGQPTSLSGTTGNQQATLLWGAATGATGYLVNETDLATGQTIQLPSVVITTSATVAGLQVGHWYRFSVTAVNDTAQGSPSSPVEIRTTGYSGSYANYYALGDSYTAGDGAPPYNGAKGCYRSINSYAYLLGSGVPTPTMIACTGSLLSDIDQTVRSSSVPGTQLNQLLSHPRGKTLITITIGGNDIGFSSEVIKCITSFFSCTRDQSSIAQKITALQPRLRQVYQELRSAVPGADIIVVGYPLLFANSSIADCHNPTVYFGLSGSEMTMIRTLAAQLDSVIAAAATQEGVSNATAQVEQAFTGHEACTGNESEEWINEIAGLNDLLTDSFHPNAHGYKAMAGAVLRALSTLYQNGMVRH